MPASAASSRRCRALFDYLCERNAVAGNPVDGVKRPAANNNEGSTPALGDAQVRRLLEAPPADTLKGVRDRATLATLLYHGIRREELCRLRVRDLQSRQGIMHIRVRGKRDKVRYVPLHAMAQRLIGAEASLACILHDDITIERSRIEMAVELTGDVVLHRAEERAGSIRAMSGGGEVFLDQSAAARES